MGRALRELLFGAAAVRGFPIQISSVRRLGTACAVALPLLAGCADGREPVTVYTPHGRDLMVLLEAEFERANPGIDLRFLDKGSQEVYDRVRSGKANPQGDVWFGGPDAIFARAAAEGLLVTSLGSDERAHAASALAELARADPVSAWAGRATELAESAVRASCRVLPGPAGELSAEAMLAEIAVLRPEQRERYLRWTLDRPRFLSRRAHRPPPAEE